MLNCENASAAASKHIISIIVTAIIGFISKGPSS
jgi:hypothetical protein